MTETENTDTAERDLVAICSSCGKAEESDEGAGDQRWLCEDCL